MRINHFSPARWAAAFLLPVFVLAMCPAALYNWRVDPLWQWPHPFHLERWHRGFNERLQKTNYLASRGVGIDTLIIGTSRSRSFKAEWLGSENGFNYAMGSGLAREFAEYIEYAKKRSAIPLNLVMAEICEFGIFEIEPGREKPSYYIANAEDGAKRIRSLFSLSTLEYALDASKAPEPGRYHVSRLGNLELKTGHRTTREQQLEAIERRAEHFAKDRYSKPYDAAYPRYLADIREAAGGAEAIIYTSPVAWQLMKLFVEMGLLEGYEARLRELAAEFGRVYHFFYPNAIVMDNGSFIDADHPTGEAAELIISIIMRLRSGEITEDTEHGGILLTQENIEELLPRFRAEMEALAGG